MVFGLASATGVTEAMEGLGDDELELEPPQAAMVANTTSASGVRNNEISTRRLTEAILLAVGTACRVVPTSGPSSARR